MHEFTIQKVFIDPSYPKQESLRAEAHGIYGTQELNTYNRTELVQQCLYDSPAKPNNSTTKNPFLIRIWQKARNLF